MPIPQIHAALEAILEEPVSRFLGQGLPEHAVNEGGLTPQAHPAGVVPLR
jgi:hypothetical protein